MSGDVIKRMVESWRKRAAPDVREPEEAMRDAARVLLAHAAASQARMPDVPFDVPSYAIAIGVGDVTAKEPNDEQ